MSGHISDYPGYDRVRWLRDAREALVTAMVGCERAPHSSLRPDELRLLSVLSVTVEGLLAIEQERAEQCDIPPVMPGRRYGNGRTEDMGW